MGTLPPEFDRILFSHPFSSAPCQAQHFLSIMGLGHTCTFWMTLHAYNQMLSEALIVKASPMDS